MQTGAVVVTALDTAIELQGCQAEQPCNLYPCPRFKNHQLDSFYLCNYFLLAAVAKQQQAVHAMTRALSLLSTLKLASVSIRLKLAKVKVAPFCA